MLSKAVFSLAALALAAAPALGAPARPAAGPPALNDALPVTAFFSDAALSDAQLSPSGRWLAFVRAQGGVSGLIVYDTQLQTAQVILPGLDKNTHVEWVRWKGEGRLVAGITYLEIHREGGRPDGDIMSYKYAKIVVAMDRDGKNQVKLLKDDNRLASQSGNFVVYLDALRSDPNHILVQAVLADGEVGAWRADLHTGAGQLVETADDSTVGWDTDRNGDIVARTRQIGRDLVIDGRAPGDKRWTEVTRIRPKDLKALADFEFLAATDQPAQLFVAVKPQSADHGLAREVRIYDFKTHTLGPPVWPALKYDIADVVTDEDSNALLGVCYWVDIYRCDFTDKDLQANFRGLETYFHGDRSVTPVSHSDDSRWWVFQVSGPNDPASYYLYDWKQKTMAELGDLFPDLPAERLGSMERFTYTARDGTQIPGYITRPPGAPKGPLPLVVLPHGGPETRDEFDFDIWSQFIATRGYLVFQPNFRGSGGYGVAFADAGHGEWGGKMQDDITDGVKQLVASGQVDPSRICIFGGSYGGYAALIGGALQPDLYKCVVSWAGISDLERMMTKERGGLFVGERSPAYDYDLKAIGDPVADKDRLTRTSAVTYAPHYGPPVLLVHGDSDTTVPVDQSREMLAALKAAGRDVRLIEVKGEDHTDWLPEHYETTLSEVAKFISAHIAPAKLTPVAPAPADLPAAPPPAQPPAPPAAASPPAGAKP